MAKRTLVQAVNDGLGTALRMDERVMVLGEDVGQNGGVFRATDGLFQEFGGDRVIDTPLSESGILGASVGLAVNGMIPIPEMQFMAFMYPGFEQVVSHVARLRYRSRSRYTLPMVIRIPYGGRIRAPELHSDSTEAYFAHTPGLTLVSPSGPYDAKGLLLSAIASPDPVLFLEPMRIYRAFREEVPDDYYTVPLYKAKVIKEGTDVTLIAWGAMVRECLDAISEVEKAYGWNVEVIDLRTLSPWDEDTVFSSVLKTGRAVVVHEALGHVGLGAEISARIHEECMLQLESPVVRVTSYDVPPPLFSLEDKHAPFANRIAMGICKTMRF
jgi:pyruvate/2-oxoglutarate/acetoin dehydrogenase E1 component